MSPTARAGAEEQLGFDSPEADIIALVEAVKVNEGSQFRGHTWFLGHALVNSGDAVADQHSRHAFLKAYDEGHTLVFSGDAKAELLVGKDEWPLPIPLVKFGDQWRFDTQQGAQEILIRRISRNELAAVQVCPAIVDAQYEYAAINTNGDGLLEYAQKFVSTPGAHDGLFGETTEGEPLSPLGPSIGRRP